MAEGHESNREAPSGEGVWRWDGIGVGGYFPRKILNFETQFGAMWCILARN